MLTWRVVWCPFEMASVLDGLSLWSARSRKTSVIAALVRSCNVSLDGGVRAVMVKAVVWCRGQVLTSDIFLQIHLEEVQDLWIRIGQYKKNRRKKSRFSSSLALCVKPSRTK